MEQANSSIDFSAQTIPGPNKPLSFGGNPTAAQVPSLLELNQRRSHQITSRIKQIEKKALEEVQALSTAHNDADKIPKQFFKEMEEAVSERIKDLEKKTQPELILISEILLNLTKFEETLLNFVRSSYDNVLQLARIIEEDDEGHASPPNGVTKSICKSEKKDVPKRKKIPSKAMTILKQWLFENIQDPYPSNQVKEDLAKKTNLTFKQVHNWFINARGRIWKKMVNQERFGNIVEKIYVQNSNKK